MSSLLRSTVSHRLTRVLRAVLPLVLLAVLVSHLGTSPFERSLQVLSAGPIAAALVLGVLTTTAQALRWRTVARGYGAADGLTRTRAVAECYRSALLNAVLPGGVLGDAVRAWRQRPARERGLRSSAQAVIGERVAGTVLLLLAVAIVLVRMEPVMSGFAVAGAIGAAGVAAPTLKRLSSREQLAVWGWSLLSLASLVTKFGVAAAALGTVPSVPAVVMLALLVLAGMSIPIGIGGFGPREAVAAVAFAAAGLSADAGVATAAAYGMLAAVSALPGVVVMLLDLRRDNRPAAADRPADQMADQIAGQPAAELASQAGDRIAARVPRLVRAGELIPVDELIPAGELIAVGGVIPSGELIAVSRPAGARELVRGGELAGIIRFDRVDRIGRVRRDRPTVRITELSRERAIVVRAEAELERQSA